MPRIAGLISLAAFAGCASSAISEPLPATLTECEAHTAVVCGTWTLRPGKSYFARWSQDSEAVITVRRFSSSRVEFDRRDTAGPTTGMHAVYRGTRSGHGAGGMVTWMNQGDTITGPWEASW
jgi:hypothetical protein